MRVDGLPNVVVLCLDTLRKDYYDEFAPRTRSLATTRFEGMRAMASWSVPSHASMVTGKLPREHGRHAWNQRMDVPVEETWFDRIPDYRRVGVSANVYAGPVFGFDSLFDSFTAISRSKWFARGMDVQEHIDTRETDGLRAQAEFLKTALAHDRPVESVLNGLVLKADDLFQRLPVEKPLDFGGKSIARALERELADDRDAPVFAFANVMEVHNPHLAFRGMDGDLYDAPKTFTDADFEIWDVNAAGGSGYESEIRAVRELYRAGADYVDRLVTGIVHDVQRETSRDTVFVVTADHGENLGFAADEGMIHHTSSLSEALLHVPFDVIDPRQADDVTVPGLASHADLGPIVEAIVAGDSLHG
ncbi:sulfatase-like hydrolase/transferase, partial [Halobium palmae]